jgi:hypothetical protein
MYDIQRSLSSVIRVSHTGEGLTNYPAARESRSASLAAEHAVELGVVGVNVATLTPTIAFCLSSPPKFRAPASAHRHHHRRDEQRHKSPTQTPAFADTMGWFDGWFGDSSGGSDPLGKLDPKVRKYLENESPVKLHPQDHEPSPSASPQPQKQNSPTSSSSDVSTPLVPPQSLFQDGRYAHLWNTYRPLSAVEAETKTDHEKLMDVLEAFKERKAKIGRTAMENCAEEQLEWNNCMKEGEWTKRAKMCSDEVRAFERCYKTQTVSLYLPCSCDSGGKVLSFCFG